MPAKVTIRTPGQIAQTPTQAVLRAANEEFTVADATGRVLTLKKPNVLAQFDLIEALGDLAKNDVYRIMCIPTIYLVAIDGSPAPQPVNKAQMRALITRLGEDGFAAINKGIKEHFPSAEDDEEEAAIKKS